MKNEIFQGEVEIEDQLEGLHAVANAANGLLDLQRVIVQGWSYGGYMALLMLARHPRVGTILKKKVKFFRLTKRSAYQKIITALNLYFYDARC